jgi:O-antigen/teichoic acid export membrane protein
MDVEGPLPRSPALDATEIDRSHGRPRRDHLITLATAFATQGILVVSGVLLARALGPEYRGFYALLLLWPVIVYQVAALAVPAALALWISREPSQVAALIRDAVPIAVIQAALATAFLYAFLHFFLMRKPPDVVSAGMATLVSVPAFLVVEYLCAIFQGYRTFGTYGVIRVTPVMFSLLAAYSTFRFRIGFPETVAIAVLGPWVASFVGILQVIRFGLHTGAPQGPRLHQGRLMLTFGMRAFLGSVYPVENFRLDQAAVGVVGTAVDAGFYSVAIAFVNLPRLVADGMARAYYPAIAASSSGTVWRNVRSATFYGSAAVTLVVAPVMATVGWLIPLLFGRAYIASVTIAYLLLLASLVAGIRRSLSEAVRAAGFPMFGTIAEVANWVAMIVAGLFLLRTTAVTVAIPLTVLAGVISALSVLVTLSWHQARLAKAEPATAPAPSRMRP